MITITINKPNKLTPTPLSPMSGFIKFDYDSQIVEYIKTLGTRVYIPEIKQWEVPLTSVATICNKLVEHDIEILGEMRFLNEVQAKLPPNFKWKTTPYTHQIEGVLFGIQNQNFLLGDDQGLGKTHQIINLAVVRKLSQGIKHCLIICGVNSTKYNWEAEVSLHSTEKAWVLGTRYTKKYPVRQIEGSSQDKLDDLNNLPDAFFLITNIETLRQLSHKQGNKTIYPIAEKINQLCNSGQIGMIAFDEAHKAKNPDSQQGRAMLKITANVPKIPMSGTFLLNNPLDLYLPLNWTGYEQHSFYQYKQHYCIMGGFDGKEIVGYKNLSELRSLLDKVMLRRTKEDVLDLPPKIHQIAYVDMSKNQKKIYEEVESAIKNNIDKIKIHNDPLSQLIRLRQATGYPGILSTSITESAKLDMLEDLVEVTTIHDKAIIYSQWETMTEVTRKRLSKYNPAYITGSVKSEDRMKEVKRFQEDPNCKIIIGTIGAMGTGLTLNAASYVIFLDEPWNRALKDQAEDRAHRIGTKGTVMVITIVCKGTIDERIMLLVQKKGKMADMLIDGKIDSQKVSQIVDYLLS
jgi:SNF2 family DNA or RNA helicase